MVSGQCSQFIPKYLLLALYFYLMSVLIFSHQQHPAHIPINGFPGARSSSYSLHPTIKKTRKLLYMKYLRQFIKYFVLYTKKKSIIFHILTIQWINNCKSSYLSCSIFTFVQRYHPTATANLMECKFS